MQQPRGPDGPGNEVAATIGAGAGEDILGTTHAKRAFKGTDARIRA